MTVRPPANGEVLAAAATIETLSRYSRAKPDYIPDFGECQQDKWSAIELRRWVAGS